MSLDPHRRSFERKERVVETGPSLVVSPEELLMTLACQLQHDAGGGRLAIEPLPGRVKMWRLMEKPIPHGVYEVLVQWDSQGGAWVAESDHVTGLVTEADSPHVPAQKLRTLIPELLELNGVPSDRTARFHVRHELEDRDVLAF